MNDGPVTLDDVGTAWVRESLESGHALAKVLLETWDIESGATYAIVPPGFPHDRLDTPHWGQIVAGPPARRDQLERFVEARLGGPWGLVVVEDPYMQPTDPVFARFATESLVYADEVYQWIASAGNGSRTALDRLIKVGYPTNAIVLSEPRTFPPAAHLTHEDLTELAAATQMIVVGAYDNVGFIAWLAERSPFWP
jgi:hypothetical protein